jgi:hypothetical protein
VKYEFSELKEQQRLGIFWNSLRSMRCRKHVAREKHKKVWLKTLKNNWGHIGVDGRINLKYFLNKTNVSVCIKFIRLRKVPLWACVNRLRNFCDI